MKKIAVSLLACSLLTLQGCSTIVNGDNQRLAITSNVEGASVEVNGNKVGQTPFDGAIKRGSDTTVTLKKEGYKSKTVILSTSIEPIFWGNVLIGGTLGSATDATNGTMYRYTPGTVHVELEKNN
jgi:hypothetical protein